MNSTLKKTALATLVALSITACSSGSHNNHRNESNAIERVSAIDYSKQNLQQLEKSVTAAKNTVANSKTKVTNIEKEITNINVRIKKINEEIAALEKSEKKDAKALQDKRNELNNATKALQQQNQLLVIANQNLTQANINLTNVEKLVVEKKAAQAKQPEQSNNQSKPEQPKQPEQSNNQSKPEQPKQEQSNNQTKPTEPSKSENSTSPELVPTGWRKLGHEFTGSTRNLDFFENIELRSSAEFPDNYPIGLPKGDVLLRNGVNKGILNDLDFEKLAKEDKQNPNLLGWHQGTIENENLDGVLIKKTDGWDKILEAEYIDKFNYLFKNTPYTTYGAFFTNQYDQRLFLIKNGDEISTLTEYSDELGNKIGQFRLNEKGELTSRIDFIDEVKGSATYKGEILASHSDRVLNQPGDGYSTYGGEHMEYSLPYKDGEITINAHFGDRDVNSFTSVYLNSKTIGEHYLDKSPMIFYKGAEDIRFENRISDDGFISTKPTVSVSGVFLGPKANEAAGTIRAYVPDGLSTGRSYDGVFSAEKQPKK
ncbi:hypothetical protein [Rodentibacter haemolyticus]|uniref:Transferrin-binding protein B C-lobe/N-lobe beta barrel domain-containing protein n=1 Tax=Rodentibacter haemolyticus TaxID=2778911 RepID=A0ABX6UYX9_9PAST|nr:hypothetical protein [Rodentibacter haemolyticus]QPB43330.1 hypothetical protein IHV77_04365 [Rodentibacter haemolyticus]